MHNEEFSLLRRSRLEQAFDLDLYVEDVVVVAMPARSGSSWLIDTLKQSMDAIHFRGELTPFLRLNGLGWHPKRRSEALEAADAATADRTLLRELSLETGWPAPTVTDKGDFAKEVLFRLNLQWPEAHLQSDIVLTAVERILADPKDRPFDEKMFTKELLAELSAQSALDVAFYDFGIEPHPYRDALPWRHLYESPPFVLFSSWRTAQPHDFPGRPLIIKSAGDLHRLSFYKRLFPKARFRVIHLARNPAASINGLIDGWTSSKYQSYKVCDLSIKGYSDLGERWRCHWWKFDLPPGWERLRDATLPQVCAWQWDVSQRTILEWGDANQVEMFLLKYEDLLPQFEHGAHVVDRLFGWLGLSRPLGVSRKIVNASRPPRLQRWKERSAVIEPLLRTESICELAQHLGYAPNHHEWP